MYGIPFHNCGIAELFVMVRALWFGYSTLVLYAWTPTSSRKETRGPSRRSAFAFAAGLAAAEQSAFEKARLFRRAARQASLQEGSGSVRFVSVPDFSETYRFGFENSLAKGSPLYRPKAQCLKGTAMFFADVYEDLRGSHLSNTTCLNAGVLQKWRIMLQTMAILDTTTHTHNT